MLAVTTQQDEKRLENEDQPVVWAGEPLQLNRDGIGDNFWLGAGMAFNPVLLAAMSDVEQREAGLASGVVNTSFMMGGALGLAILASLAASRTETLAAGGDAPLVALTGGYHVAFLVGALFAFAAAALGAALLRPAAQAEHMDAESLEMAEAA